MVSSEPNLNTRGFEVLFILPPDFNAPIDHKRYRFPPQGPAIVAACIAQDGMHVRIADLELSVARRALSTDLAPLDDDSIYMAHLRGQRSEALERLASEILDRVGPPACDAVAFSLDRHTQIRVAALLAIEVKRRWNKPVILGGANADGAQRMLSRVGARGVDIATFASTPGEIRMAFSALRELPGDRFEIPVEAARQIAVDADEWPLADFSIYDLSLYRRDPFAIAPEHYKSYDGSVGARLFLPYHLSFDCQYKCTFCQRGGKQSVKSMDRVVRDLAALSERYDCRDFMLVDAQINLVAAEFAQALIDAKLGIQWTDSYRVMPSKRGVLEQLAKAGCAGLTFGVESASDRMLKKMVKGHRAADATRVVREAHDHGIMTRVNLLPCFPGETREDHLETCAWLAEMADAIDDIAPSSFYLAEGSPVGQDAEKYGIRMRGLRTLSGDHKFRKNMDSMEYDEIDGMTFEERSATFRPYVRSCGWRG